MSSTAPRGQRSVCDEPAAYRFVIRWPVRRDDLAGIAGRLAHELDGRAPGILVCDLADTPADGAADAVTVDALARLAVTAQRRQWTVRFVNVPGELASLIAMVGLATVLLGGEPLAS